MRWFVFCLFILTSCGTGNNSKAPRDLVTGNWFVLYAREGILTERQQQAYTTVEDSLSNEKCLKLISFRKDGQFRQLDSLKSGQWVMRSDGIINVTDGGNGFEQLRLQFVSMDQGLLKLAENIRVGGEAFTITWYLKKMDEGEPALLFEPGSNDWRRPPAAPETNTQLSVRLASMLRFYAIYFRLIARESSYFMPARIIPPLKFYQHAIGLKELQENSLFARMFYSTEQAKQAWMLLRVAIRTAHFNFPSKNSYSEEYALMLDSLAKDLTPK